MNVFELDPAITAAEARATFAQAGFVEPDGEHVAWRFFVYDSTAENVRDAVLGLDIEPLVQIRALIGPGDRLYLTNVRAERRPDLMGVPVDWFEDRRMAVRVELNTYDAAGQAANAGKSAPVMLSRVRSLSEAAAGIYDNVVVCERGSALSFVVQSWGTAGFGYRLGPQSGALIAEALYVTNGGQFETTTAALLYRYQTSGAVIVAEATDVLGVPGGAVVAAQRIETRTWALNAYAQGGQTYTWPGLASSIEQIIRAAIDAVRNVAIRNGLFGAALLPPPADQSVIRAAVVPGETITPGTTAAGGPSGQSLGSLSVINEDDPTTQPIGVALFYLFVFDSAAEAARIVGAVNASAP